MRYGVSGWSAHFLGLFISDIPGAPDFFHKKVPVETGMGWYLRYLYEIGELGPGKRIDSAPLPMDQWGELSFRRALLDAVSRRVGIGDALAEGCFRAAEKWGRLESGSGKRCFALPGLGRDWSLDPALRGMGL